MTRGEREGRTTLPAGSRPYRHGDLTSQGAAPTGTVSFEWDGKTYDPGSSRHWTTTIDGLRRLGAARRLVPPTPHSLQYVRYLDDYSVAELANVWTDTGTGAFTEDKVYAVQTNTKVIERCLLMTTDPGDLVLDPTCGSGTTAYVAEQWGRRWITIDTSRVALALARSRLMAAKYPYYLLADSDAGLRKEAELSGEAPPAPMPTTTNDVRRGFVYERVPHVTLKSIAQNPDIHEGMSREEIDAAIARHAETETLFDRPYEDRKIVRVSGPFTVESLSPHRVLVDGPEDVPVPKTALAEDAGRFVTTILDNLRRAGVQNTKRAERLEFSRLDHWPGTYVQALGEYVENGQPKAVAVAIGPEFGTVGRDLVIDAAKEAVKIADLLVVCGFAFDPLAAEESSLGRLTIVQARMNPDLAMGDELLKKTGAGNLFMIFGEPDIEVREVTGEGSEPLIEVEICGLDVYDPTTGVLRASSVDDIAAWFLDTDYDSRCFTICQAFFPNKDAWKKLERALKGTLDAERFEQLTGHTSFPFKPGQHRRVAVKVIDQRGNEVMRVLPLETGALRY
ncbi:MAG: DNA methyltransferase [Gaiellaceae bacterium]